VTRGETPCLCGAPYATIIEIQGRLADRFNLPDGRSLHPYALVGPLVLEAPWVRRYQIVQERLDRIAIKLVPVGEPPADAAATVTRRMAAELGGNVQVEVQLVKEIPPDANGKFRPYYSLVSPSAPPG
jgi:phenylacetate-coenzyme A ligase PaaK-like adenylate-forming protein